MDTGCLNLFEEYSKNYGGYKYREKLFNFAIYLSSMFLSQKYTSKVFEVEESVTDLEILCNSLYEILKERRMI